MKWSQYFSIIALQMLTLSFVTSGIKSLLFILFFNVVFIMALFALIKDD